MKLKIATLFVASLTPLAASAQDSYGYFGGELGFFSYSESYDGLNLDDEAISYGFYGGYQINESFAIEAGYDQTGDLEWSGSAFISGVGTVSASLVADYQIMRINAYGYTPIGDGSLRLFGGPGFYDADLDATVSASAGSISDSESYSDSDDGFMVTVGLQFGDDDLQYRWKFDWFDTEGNVDAWNMGVGIVKKF